MDLLEYQGKQLFARHGVPVPSGSPAGTVEQAVAAADEIGYPCVIKAQVLIGGRGKAGGIKVAQDRAEAEEHSRAILGMDIRGFTVHEVWVEAASDIAAEYYASIVFDRAAKKPLVMLSTQGGMDIEEVADNNPDAIARLHVDPLLGFQDFHARRLAFEAGVDADVVRPVGALLSKLYDAFASEEAMLVEVNPMIVTSDRKVMALDAKVTLDGNSLFRHPDNAELRDAGGEDPQEQMAKERGLTYVKLDGNVGILGNGAGLVMSTLDVVAQAGGKPANFLDAGGGSKAEAITQAVEVILSDPKVTAVLFNIFGGITRCDEVARGLIEAFDQIKPTVPFVVRLDGTNDKEGRRLLAEADLPNVHAEATMLGAAKRVVELAGVDRRRRARGRDGAARRGDRDGAGRRRRSSGGGCLMAILVDENTKLCVSGITGREGTFHAMNNRRYGTQVVSGVTPGKGGQDVEGVPVFNTFHDAVAETGANTAMIFVPPRFAADSILEAEDAGIDLIIAITEGIPAHDELRVYNHLLTGTSRLVGPNCPGILSPGKANVGIIPAVLLQGGQRRRRLALRHADLPDRQRAGPERLRQLEHRRHRRRPRPGLELHRHHRAVRGRRRDRADRDGGRDRRLGRGGGRRLHRRQRVEARGRLHRRLHRAARQDDGPRGRDRVGLQGHRGGEGRGARGEGRAGRPHPDRGRGDRGRDRRLAGALTATSSARAR